MPTVLVAQALQAPVSQRAEMLLGLREDQWFDRKSARISPRDLAEDLVGFANAEGGTIVVGLFGGEVEGVDGLQHTASQWLRLVTIFMDPPIKCQADLLECRTGSGRPDHLLVIEVEPSDAVHATSKDEVYLRVGDENRRLNFRQRQELLYDKGQATYEGTEVAGGTLADLDQQLFKAYAAALGHPDPERLLTARGLRVGRRGRLTTAALLLFARDPQRWYPEAYVRVLRYRGSERGSGSRQQLVVDERIAGPIPLQLQSGRLAILTHLPTRRALGQDGRFADLGIVPEPVWLEGLVNAVIHRSYSMHGDHVRVELFDDRVEISSPGRFPGLSDPSDPLAVTRFARNPRIARVCSELNFGQELGEGIRRMVEEMRLAGLADPSYRQTAGSVQLTLSATPVDVALESRLPLGARDLLRLVREAGRAGTGELVEASSLSRPVVLRQLRHLERARMISWVGHSRNDPRAYWTLAPSRLGERHRAGGEDPAATA
ncbi:MAG TPA: ATP-binding protein [Candidatus Saccharimonadales bacterium]|nr:ATP-binding protein [Candidatus Saccharimonadales bacterium]